MASDQGTGRSPQPPAKESLYSFEKVWATKDSFSLGKLSATADSIYRSPCYKQSLLAASLVATLLAAHRFKEGGSRGRIVNDAFLGFLGIFQIQWYLCRKDEVERKEAVRRFYQQQSAMQQGKLRPEDIGGFGRPPSGGTDGSGASGSDPLQGELERLVQYDLPTVTEGASKEVLMR